VDRGAELGDGLVVAPAGGMHEPAQEVVRLAIATEPAQLPPGRDAVGESRHRDRITGCGERRAEQRIGPGHVPRPDAREPRRNRAITPASEEGGGRSCIATLQRDGRTIHDVFCGIWRDHRREAFQPPGSRQAFRL
jgi:hypothetical protein